MPDPIPRQYEQQSEPPWFEVQAKLLENAVDTRSDTSGLSNHVLWLINERANLSPEAQNGTLTDVYREVLYEGDIRDLHEALSDRARMAFARDAVDLTTPGRELPEHAGWLKPNLEAEGTSTRDLLIEALVIKFPEFKQIVDPYGRGRGIEPITGAHTITDEDLQALLDPNRVPRRAEPAYPIVPETTYIEEETAEGAGEITDTFEQELAECQDAIQLRTLLEKRAETIKAEIDQRSADAKVEILNKDNQDSRTLLKVENTINAGDLPRALSMLDDKGISEKQRVTLITAIESKLVGLAVNWLRGDTYYYLQEAKLAVDAMPLPDFEKAKIRSYLDADIFKIIESAGREANGGDEIESELQNTRASGALKYISDPVVADKIKEVLDIKESQALPPGIDVEDTLPADILTPRPPSTASIEEWNKWYMTIPPENLSNREFETQLLVKHSEALIRLSNGSFSAYDGLSRRDRKASAIVNSINSKLQHQLGKDIDNRAIIDKTFRRIDSKITNSRTNLLAKASFAYQILSLAETMFIKAPVDQPAHITCDKVVQFISEFAPNAHCAGIMREGIDMKIMELAKSAAKTKSLFDQVDTGSTVVEIVKYASSDRVARRIMQALGMDPPAEIGGMVAA